MITLKLHSPPYLASQTTLLGGGYFAVNQQHTTLQAGTAARFAPAFLFAIYLCSFLTVSQNLFANRCITA